MRGSTGTVGRREHDVALWVVPYLRSAFVIENAGTLYRVTAVAIRGLVGLEVRLP
jgi:hypothetical protein